MVLPGLLVGGPAPLDGRLPGRLRVPPLVQGQVIGAGEALGAVVALEGPLAGVLPFVPG